MQSFSFLRNVEGRREVFISVEGWFMPDPTISSLSVILDFPSMSFLYYFATSTSLPIRFPCLYWQLGISY
jgi:hypothetical protein